MPFILFRERRAHCEYWTCKPNSVEDDHSSRPAIAGGLKRPTRKFRAPSRHACGVSRNFSPIWSCSVWGLPCAVHCCPAGALLPHLFTLTGLLQGLRSKLLRPREPRKRDSLRCSLTRLIHPAVFSLWHFPSTGLESGRPGVTWHIALWSSDFPLPSRLSPVKPA